MIVFGGRKSEKMAAKQKRKQKEKNTVTKWETQSGKEERRRRAS